MNHRLRFLPEISRSPLACAVVSGRYRRGLLRRFPYSIYYVVEGDSILVVGLFHSARRPATTAATLEDRAGPAPASAKAKESSAEGSGAAYELSADAL